MWKWVLLAAIATGFYARPQAAEEPMPSARVVGYYAAWNSFGRQFFIKNLKTSGAAARLTHINYAFADISPELRCQLGDAQADIGRLHTAQNSVDGEADPAAGSALRGNFNQLRKLKKKFPHIKVLISIGGWSWSSRFSDAALTPWSREAFVASAVELFIRGNFAPGVSVPGLFDGIDLDWEYPGAAGATQNFRAEDRQNFTALLTEFRRQMDAQGQRDGRRYLLTIATSGTPQKTEKMELEKIHPQLDWINVMAYDFAGGWEKSTGFQSALIDSSGKNGASCERALNAHLAGGIPAGKLNLGVPFYGRGWQGVEPGPHGDGLRQKAEGAAKLGEGEGLADYRLLAKLGPGFKLHRDETSKAACLYNAETRIFWTLDDAETMRAKADYIKAHKLGGAMIWELAGDDENATLLRALSEGLSR